MDAIETLAGGKTVSKSPPQMQKTKKTKKAAGGAAPPAKEYKFERIKIISYGL